MKSRRLFSAARMVSILTLSVTVLSAATARAESPQPSHTGALTASPPAIEPQVGNLLERACAVLSSAQSLGYHAEINFDSVLPSSVKLQYAAAMDVALQRPDRLMISYQSDIGAKRVWYDGKTLTIFDPPHAVFAAVQAPNSIDATLEEFGTKQRLTLPLRMLDISHPCQEIYKQVIHSKYVGINDADGKDCDHLAFVATEANWQVWLDRGKQPLPRRIVITYKLLPAQPQWEATLSEWRLDESFPATLFRPKIPTGAIKADFVNLTAEGQK